MRDPARHPLSLNEGQQFLSVKYEPGVVRNLNCLPLKYV
jgi:hypothetical protein